MIECLTNMYKWGWINELYLTNMVTAGIITIEQKSHIIGVVTGV